MTILFDMDLRAARRDRAARSHSDRFLLQRAFDDCLERIDLVARQFDSALLIGCPHESWPERLSQYAAVVEVADPGGRFAGLAGGSQVIEDEWIPPQGRYDLVITIGCLDTVNNLPTAFRTIRWAMTANAFFLGAVSGGDTIPQLRRAMQAADAVGDAATPHVHPRIEASAVAPLLEVAGFQRPIVDVDRVQVAYSSLPSLVADLRAMAATNILISRSRSPLTRAAYRAAKAAFEGPDGERTVETFEILHFAAWT